MQFSRFFQFTLGLFLYASYSSELKAATIDLDGPSSDWLPILVGDRFDPVDDEQSQTSGLDLVGNAMHPSLYSQYDDKGTPKESDDEIGFRFRIGADSDDNVYLIGLDANHDGTVDLFISADSRGNTRAIALWGSGNCNQDLCNNGPSTTTVAKNPTFTESYSADNYHFVPVSTLDSNVADRDVGDLDGEDHFVSYKLRFENLNASLQQESGLQITKSTPIRYIAFSLTQPNSINGDFDGINDNTEDTSKTFEELGLFTPPLTADPSSSNNSISGVVFNDTDGDGVLDPGESGISEVTITLSGSATGTTVTDTSGYYTFQFLATGTYTVSETDPANAIAESGSANTVTDIVLTGATLYTVNFADVLESVNQAPVAQPQSVTIEEDTPLAITLSGRDTDGSIHRYDIVQAPKNGSLTGTMPDLTYSPNEHYHGSDRFTFTVTDNDGLTSVEATVSIIVMPVDEKPEAQPQSVTIAENTPLAVTLSGTDADGSIHRFDIVQSPSHGALTGTIPNLVYTPVEHYHGSDSFTFTVTDNDGLTSAEATVSITVTPVDERPNAQPQSITIEEDTPLAITLSGTDADGSIHRYDIVQAPKNGSLVGTIPNLVYTPNEHYYGSDSFTFTVTDNDGLTSAEATVSISVTPVNDLPIASNDEVKLGANEREILIDVLSNDEDVDGDILTIVQAASDDGEVSVLDNQIHFIVKNDFDVSMAIEYEVDDGHGGRDSAAVTIWMDLPEPPVVTAPPTVSIDANALFTKVALGTATAVDHYGNALPVSLVSGDPFFQPGSNTALWQACDEEGRCGTAEQSVLVRPLISLAKDQVILEGNEVGVEVVMNGPHFEYPVIIPYTVSGTADSDDHSLKSGTIIIENGSSAVLRFNVHRDSVVEGDESIEVTLDDRVNPGNKRIHRITISEGNLPPEITLTASQAGEQRLVAAYGQGEMQVHANLTDPNKNDSHNITWTADEVLEAHLSHEGLNARFMPDQLPVGLYSLSVRATDQSGESDNATIYLEVREQLPILDGSLDSDGDNISDADEGYVDVDLDGIPDYLDQVTDECNVLPEMGNYFKGYIIEGDPAVCLRVGKFSTLGVTGGGQIVDEDIIASEEDELIPDPDADNVGGIFDFIAYNLPESGQSFQIVLPQRKAIPAEAVYRKLVKSTVTGQYQWETLIEGEGNKIHSTLGEPGYCPPPGGEVWTAGLTEGDWCVQLTLVDGGHYDNDGRENGSVVDPGGVAVMKNTNTPPVANDDASRLRDGQTHLIDVLVNDSDADGDDLTITSANAELGEVMVNNDNTLSYTAPMDFFGNDAIQYTISDGKGGTDQAVVNVDVYINHAPVAADDSVQAEPNKAIVIPVLDNDSDADGDTLTVNQAIATVGSVTVQLDGTLLYEPAKDYIGEVWIDYQVVDSEGDSTWAQVQVVIQGSTIVKTEGGAGGSIGQLWLAMMMIAVWLRKQKRAVSHVSLAVLCSLLLLPQQPVMASETLVRKHGSGPWFVSGNINYAVSDVSQSDIDRDFADAGINARTLSLDEQRIAYSVGLGYFVTENWFVEGGYLNTGDVELTLQSADATSSAFYDAVEHIYPESGDGPYVQLGYKHWINNSWAVTGKVGAFFWEGDYLSSPVNSGSGSGNDAPSSTDLLYGISVDYHLTRDWVSSIQAQRVEFDNYPTTMLGLNLAYHFGGEHETPPVAAFMDSDEDGVQDEQDTCSNTPVTHAVDDNGCSRWTTVPQSFEALVLFANDSTRIESQYKLVLNELAKAIDRYQPEEVTIRGYASSPASSLYNMDLSLRRAEAVRIYLSSHHQIDLQRLKVEAYGESSLKNDGDSEFGHAQNRRVEVALSYNEKHALIR